MKKSSMFGLSQSFTYNGVILAGLTVDNLSSESM